jgi:hypothetical protein
MMLNAVAKATKAQTYFREAIEGSDRYEHLIDDPLLLGVGRKFRDINAIAELRNNAGDTPRVKWLSLLNDFTGNSWRLA